MHKHACTHVLVCTRIGTTSMRTHIRTYSKAQKPQGDRSMSFPCVPMCNHRSDEGMGHAAASSLVPWRDCLKS